VVEPPREPDWVYAPDPPACPIHGDGVMEFCDFGHGWRCMVPECDERLDIGPSYDDLEDDE
jgi:hypothetical protein